MSTVVQILPLVLTFIAFVFCIKAGKFFESLKFGLIFNLLVVLIFGAIPVIVYLISRMFCDGIL